MEYSGLSEAICKDDVLVLREELAEYEKESGSLSEAAWNTAIEIEVRLTDARLRGFDVTNW